MKQLFLLLVPFFMLTACGSSGSKSETKTVGNSDGITKSFVAEQVNVLAVDQLIDLAADNVGEEVVVKGVVTHVCKHSGKRCFLKDESGKTSIRVEAKGEIGGFNSELNGTRMMVKGFIRENRLTEEYINQWEQKTLEQKEKAEIDQNQCSAELANIEEMRNWMTANNKKFYSVFYVDGVDYEVLD